MISNFVKNISEAPKEPTQNIGAIYKKDNTIRVTRIERAKHDVTRSLPEIFPHRESITSNIMTQCMSRHL